MVVTQKLRREGTVISLVSDGREKGCPPAVAPSPTGTGVPVSFELTRDDTIDVRIVRYEDETLVRTLARDRTLEGGRRYCFRWDGSKDNGGPAHPGRYRLQVTLRSADRVATAGQPIQLQARSSIGGGQPG